MASEYTTVVVIFRPKLNKRLTVFIVAGGILCVGLACQMASLVTGQSPENYLPALQYPLRTYLARKILSETLATLPKTSGHVIAQSDWVFFGPRNIPKWLNTHCASQNIVQLLGDNSQTEGQLKATYTAILTNDHWGSNIFRDDSWNFYKDGRSAGNGTWVSLEIVTYNPKTRKWMMQFFDSDTLTTAEQNWGTVYVIDVEMQLYPELDDMDCA